MTAIFFDLDGTLMDHSAAQRASAQILRARCYDHGFSSVPPAEEFLSAWQEAEHIYFERYLAGALSFQEQRRKRVCAVLNAELNDNTADTLFTMYLDAYEASWRTFPDVRECLEKLHPLKVGIISNGDGDQQRRKLKSLGFFDAFDPVVISGDVGISKPNAGIFLEACRLAAVEPNRAVYVGDRLETDAIAACDAGLVGVWLNREGLAAPEECPHEIQSLLDLPRLVEVIREVA